MSMLNAKHSIVFLASASSQAYRSTKSVQLGSGVVVAQVTSKAAKGFQASMGVLGLGTCSAIQCGKAGVKATWEQAGVAFNF